MTGEQFDDPNRQAVGLEPAWVEGTGGDDSPPGDEPDLDAMTKDELLAEAQARGLDVNASMTKAEIRAAIDKG